MPHPVLLPAAGPAEDLLRKVIVGEALRELSPAHREVLNETVLRGRTVNEAAEVLGIAVDTVRSRVYYAVRALRLALAERGDSSAPTRSTHPAAAQLRASHQVQRDPYAPRPVRDR